MRITEARTHDALPKPLQELIELEQQASLLREKCIVILKDGSLERSNGPARIFKRINNFGWTMFLGHLTLDEYLAKRVYRTKIKDENKTDPFIIAIMSLGEIPPQNANHVLVYVDGLHKEHYLDIGKGVPVFRPGVPGGKEVIRTTSADPKADMQELKSYSRMVDIVGANLKASKFLRSLGQGFGKTGKVNSDA